MTPDFSNILSTLGTTGFAIYVLWKMSEKKDQTLISELDKRDTRNTEQQKTFTDYTMKVHESTTKQLGENTKALSANSVALSENTKVMLHVSEHLNQPRVPPAVLIQNNQTSPEAKNQKQNE